LIFVTSWDDGHPLDERLGDLLDRFGLRATFFVPIRNCEGRPVLSTDALRSLDKRFEIGSHTLDHVSLPGLPQGECVRQIVEGKIALEQRLGHTVDGFCYPRGKWNRSVRKAVETAGCSYARTVENLWLDSGEDKFSIPTSMQIFPHGKQLLLRNYLLYCHHVSRFRAITIGLQSNSWLDFVVRLLDADLNEKSVLHIWGHSWEIEEQGLWAELEEMFSIIASRHPRLCTISDLVADGRLS
jgi:peptidoglycan/xylan/chitin deacetylase (PgdA/CDA1 family)